MTKDNKELINNIINTINSKKLLNLLDQNTKSKFENSNEKENIYFNNKGNFNTCIITNYYYNDYSLIGFPNSICLHISKDICILKLKIIQLHKFLNNKNDIYNQALIKHLSKDLNVIKVEFSMETLKNELIPGKTFQPYNSLFIKIATTKESSNIISILNFIEKFNLNLLDKNIDFNEEISYDDILNEIYNN